MDRTRRQILVSITSLAVVGGGGGAKAASTEGGETQAILDAARASVVDYGSDKDFAGFRAALPRAKAVLLFPRIVAAGLVVGGSGGNGVLMVRNATTGNWNGPVFYTLGSVSVGLQAGEVNGSLALVVQSERALDSLYSTSTKLGVNATAALGSRSANAASGTGSDIVAYSKVKGAFAALAVDGVVLSVRKSLNEAFYHRTMTPSEMVLAPPSATPAADPLRDALRAAGR